MTDTAVRDTAATERPPHPRLTHVLAQARVRSLSARPVGPLKVGGAQEHPTRDQ